MQETVAPSSFPELRPNRQHKAKTHLDTNTELWAQKETPWNKMNKFGDPTIAHFLHRYLPGKSNAGQMGPAWPSMKINDFGRLGGCDSCECLLPCAKGHSQQSSKDLSISVSNSPFGTAQRAPNLGLLCLWQSN